MLTSSPAPTDSFDARHYLPSLTGLRFVAAALILVGHLIGTVEVFGLKGGTITCLGMPLFYVLSGFIIHYNYGASFFRGKWSGSSREFMVARFSRIYPLYLFFFLFCLIFDGLLYHWTNEGKVWLMVPVCLAGIFSWFPFLTHGYLLLIFGRFGVAWSISTEFFFYLAYLFFARRMYGLKTQREVWGFFWICLGIGYLVQIPGSLATTEPILHQIFGPGHDMAYRWDIFYNSYYRWAFYLSPYAHVAEFFLGCATAQLFIRCGKELSSRKWTGKFFWGALALLLMLFMVGYEVDTFAGRHPIALWWMCRYIYVLNLNFLYAPMMAFIILACALRDAYEPEKRTRLAHPKLVFLGEISLSLYLLHPIILSFMPFNENVGYIPVQALFVVVFTIAVSIGTYTLIEVPARRFLRRVLGAKGNHSPVVVRT